MKNTLLAILAVVILASTGCHSRHGKVEAKKRVCNENGCRLVK